MAGLDVSDANFLLWFTWRVCFCDLASVLPCVDVGGVYYCYAELKELPFPTISFVLADISLGFVYMSFF